MRGLGLYAKTAAGKKVNRRPVYVKVDDDAVAMWWIVGQAMWWQAGQVDRRMVYGIGRAEAVAGWSATDDAQAPEDIRAPWYCAKADERWARADGVQIFQPSPLTDEVAVTGETTREQREAEKRKNAIDLEYDTATPRKRSRSESQGHSSRSAWRARAPPRTRPSTGAGKSC